MSARRQIIAALSEDSLGGIATLSDVDRATALVDALTDEVLAADGQAYPGEVDMLRGLVATLNAVAEHGDLADVKQLLDEYAADDTAARTGRPDSDFFQKGHTYSERTGVTDWRFRVDTVTTHPEDGERTALGWRHFRGEWEPYAYGEDDFEIHQLADRIDTTSEATR